MHITSVIVAQLQFSKKTQNKNCINIYFQPIVYHYCLYGELYAIFGQMKILSFIIIFLYATNPMFAQELKNHSYGMATDENITWLKKASISNKEQQLILIQNRFFRKQEFKKSETDDAPIVLANGIVINELTNIKLKNLLANRLTPEKVQITILEKAPEGLYINKRWTGMIVLTIIDKEIKKLLKSYKPEHRRL